GDRQSAEVEALNAHVGEILYRLFLLFEKSLRLLALGRRAHRAGQAQHAAGELHGIDTNAVGGPELGRGGQLFAHQLEQQRRRFVTRIARLGGEWTDTDEENDKASQAPKASHGYCSQTKESRDKAARAEGSASRRWCHKSTRRRTAHQPTGRDLE